MVTIGTVWECFVALRVCEGEEEEEEEEEENRWKVPRGPVVCVTVNCGSG